MSTVQSELDLSYKQRYQGVVIPEAYERLILDTIRGDQQHFVRRDELKAAWEIFTPLLHRIDEGLLKSVPYKPGTRGPAEADALLEKAGYVQTHGYIWIPPTLQECGKSITKNTAIAGICRSSYVPITSMIAHQFITVY